jgi:hypothetical protein
MVNVVRPEVAAEIAALFCAGMSTREISRLTGRAKNTVARYRPERAMEPTCACGREARHRGWCRVRLSRSPRRRETLARMHERQRNSWRRRMDAARRDLDREFMRTGELRASALSAMRDLLRKRETES